MKRILGLDLGTNSIGWALTSNDFDNKLGNIEGLGSRIIPMSQDILGKFDSGVSISQTAERTKYRGVRRIMQRFLLRRERLHRILHILDFLPEHYSESIDFDKKFGQFKPEREEKLSFYKDENGKNQFLFSESYQEMLSEFKLIHPDLKQVPYDWTIYYLRKKALTQKISKEELAWILLNFNQKRGYYQLRGEEEDEDKDKGKSVELYSLLVEDVIDTKEKNKSGQTLYKIVLENGWDFIKPSSKNIEWKGKTKDFIVTTELEEDGITPKKNKEGREKRSFRAPSDNDWTLVKTKTEENIKNSRKTVGCYIFEALLRNPNQKIKGELVRTIERDYYKSELKQILENQIVFHKDTLEDRNLYKKCIEELYRNNEPHKNNIKDRDFGYLFLDDIIFYQRPLKSKTSLISDCSLEFRPLKDKKGNLVKDSDGKQVLKPLKCIAKSNPIYQEFRLLQFVKNIKIFKKEIANEDIDVTSNYLKTDKDLLDLFNWLNDKDEISQKQFLAYPKFKLKEDKFRWNFAEDKSYPCNETRNQFLKAISKIDVEKSFFDTKNTRDLWHILYSVTDKIEIEKAITTFAKRHNLPDEFVEKFSKLKPYERDYGSNSEKAIKKLLALMRFGSDWDEENIDAKTLARIDKLLTGEFDEKIGIRVREKAIQLKTLSDFRGLPLWLASYIIYDRHSEAGDISRWKTPADIAWFLNPKNKSGFKQHSLRNPIVEQVITETLRVVKDIWEDYGQGKENFFDEIHIELGREIKQNLKKRKKDIENIRQNENTNLRIKAILAELKNDGIAEVRPYSPSQQELLKIYEEGVYSNEIKKEELVDIDKIRKSTKPTPKEITRYKLWLAQGYVSPYTGNTIPLSELFTPKYEIEHIIPQSRFFDDSFLNKVICESVVNKYKDNQTAMEFINDKGGEIVNGLSTNSKMVKILTKEEYVQHITSYYSGEKQKRLLSEEIPEKFIERQLNDTRYISKIVKNLLSRIVREEDEQEVTSKHVVPLNGKITSLMKQNWGLNDVWNDIITPRFEHLNKITDSNKFGQRELKKDEFGNTGKQVFQTAIPDEIARGFSKKRIDHRHHALDALVIACINRTHINYLNNLNAKDKEDNSVKEELRGKLCFKTKPDEKGNYKWIFRKPWTNFTKDAKDELNKTIISFKQNTRVINKTVNKYQVWKEEDGVMKKVTVKQTKGDNWAIRKPMHAETVSGRVVLKRIKENQIAIENAIEKVEWIVDKIVKKELKERIKLYPNNNAGLKKHLKAFPIMVNGKAVSKVQIYEKIEATATRKRLDGSFDEKRIKKITDLGIQKILLNHLQQEIYQNAVDEKGNKIPANEAAFSEDGLEELNKNIATLNNGKKHKPIKNVHIFEEGNKFSLGQSGNKKHKYVEAAKGTNLFFAIYRDKNGKRDYKTIPLNEVIERQKQGLSSAPEMDENGNQLLFTISPNDLVYVPTVEEINDPDLVNTDNLTKERVSRIYKMEKTSKKHCYFIQNNIANLIYQYDSKSKFGEFGSQDKLEITPEGVKISEYAWKLEVDRLGKIKKIIR